MTVIAMAIAFIMPREIDWRPSFEKDETKPFGSLIVHDELNRIFPSDEISVNTKPFYNDIGGRDYKNHNLIMLDYAFNGDSLELAQLFNFVRNGNNAFISSTDFGYGLQDSLGFETQYDFNYDGGNLNLSNADALLYLYNQDVEEQQYYVKTNRTNSYFVDDYDSTYYLIDSLNQDVKSYSRIGYFKSSEEDERELSNFIRIQYGEGNFYLHLFPYAFTNYGILKDENHEYVSKCLSYLPQQNTIWDEYYKPNSSAAVAIGQSPFSVLLRSSSMKWAYWLGFFTLLLFMLFYAKRRQRIIPVIEPYKNESLDFSKTIASLYFQKHNNADLAKKKARYFRDYVSRRFYLKHFSVDDKGIDSLVGKSNYDRDQLTDLFNWINKGAQPSVSDRELIEISKRLNHFYRDN